VGQKKKRHNKKTAETKNKNGINHKKREKSHGNQYTKENRLTEPQSVFAQAGQGGDGGSVPA